MTSRPLTSSSHKASVRFYAKMPLYFKWGLLGSILLHFCSGLFVVVLFSILFHVKSVEELMKQSGSIAENGPAPEENLEITLVPEELPPPPTPTPEFIKQVEPPKPPKEKPKPVIQKPVPIRKPEYTAPKATGTGESAAYSRLVVGSSNFPHPHYPDMAKSLGQTGTVVIRIHFNGSGGVEDAEVESSSGSTILDSSTRSFIMENWHEASYANYIVSVPIVYHLN